MTRIVVVFPAPLGPRRPRTSPCSTSKETSEIACVLPKWRLTPTTWTPAVTDAGPLRPVVGRVGAHPFGVAETGRDRRLDRKVWAWSDQCTTEKQSLEGGADGLIGL